MKEIKWNLTREKHLDHMVKVVPFIVFCYAIQCFMISKVAPGEFSTWSLSILGGFLAAMIASFVTYDLKHKVTFNEDSFTTSFLFGDKTYKYSDIWEINIAERGQSFTTMTFKTNGKKFSFYFVDDAEKIERWILDKKNPSSIAA